MYTILIVDDERNEREGIEKLIHKYHYNLNVVQAAGGKEALSAFESYEIDILLTDIKMPVMTGIELIKTVHQKGWNPICIIYSAYGEFEYAQDAISLGVIQYLLKPIKLQDFKKLFDQILSMCDDREYRRKEKEEIEIRLENAENARTYSQLIRYLESESGELCDQIGKLLKDTVWLPVIVCGYSPIFSRYWENYEDEIRKIFGDQTIIINRDDTQIVILARTAGGTTQKRRAEYCDSLLNMSQKYGSKVFVIMGKESSEAGELKAQYETMKEQLDYQFFITESTYFLSEERGFVKKESDMLSIHFQKIITSAKLKDFHGIKSEFEKAFKYVEKNIGFSSVYIKYNFSEIIKQCCDILSSRERLMEVVEDIYDSRSISQVKCAVDRLISQIEKEEKVKNGENRVTILAKKIINEHYQEYTLSVSSIADELGISSAYLSTQFKAETDQHLVKYICYYRLEKAKELLITTNLKVGEIAKKVGYLNVSYFISLFRNNMGCSPAKYRERILKNEESE